MASKYNKNVIDIDTFTTTSEFQTMILDESGHPNEKGLELLSNMITGNQGSPVRPLLP
jgi:hypothetical protein